MALALTQPAAGAALLLVLLVAAMPGTAAAQEEDASSDWAALAARRLPDLEPCTVPNVPETLLCGSLAVPEDRSESRGRKISLNLIVVPAQSDSPPTDAVFVFEGGPGGAATKRAAGSVWSGPVRQRDIVLVDQRGTGASHPLDCDLGGNAGEVPGQLSEMFPPEAVRSCAQRLAAGADLARYTSIDHADDIEDVRRWLGYDSINLRGGSYGTAAMTVYALRYPESTRTLFGIGWASPLRSNLAERGVNTERALTRLTALCDEDPGCFSLVPGLGYRIAELLARLEGSPPTVSFPDPQAPGETLSLALNREWMAETLRLNLYFAFTSRALPWAVHRAHADDWAPLAELGVLIERTFRSTLSYGVLLTVQCSELMDFDAGAALERGEATLFGNYRLEQQMQGCAEWPHEPRREPLVAPGRTLPIPTLLLSGFLDPVTPPDYAEDAMQVFPESLHVVLPEAGHGPFDLAESWVCVHQMWGDLLAHADVTRVDTECTERMKRPPFIVDGETYRTYVDDVLASGAF